MSRRIRVGVAVAATVLTGTLAGLTSAWAAAPRPPSVFDVILPNHHVVLFLVRGLPLDANVVCTSSTQHIGAPFDTLTCRQYNK